MPSYVSDYKKIRDRKARILRYAEELGYGVTFLHAGYVDIVMPHKTVRKRGLEAAQKYLYSHIYNLPREAQQCNK